MTQLLVIESVSIRQDAHGRYSLNDLHKAAMANGKATESQKPSEFLSSQGVQAFVAALDAELRVQKGGNYPGTWASREILLKYATWLHPEIESAIYKNIIDFEAIIAAINDFEVPADCPDLYVYAIRNVTTGNIKLGISRDPQERLKQLQTGNDCELQLVAYRKAENRFEDEVSIHRHANPYHIRGEWFDEGVNKMLIDHGLAEAENKIPEQNHVTLLFSEWLPSHNQDVK